MKKTYVPKTLCAAHAAIVEQANAIIAQYQAEGFTLTLRQLFYQFVARDLLPNNLRSYKRLGSIITDARLAGLIDWEAIEDRLRILQAPSTWRSPEAIVEACARQFRLDAWAGQEWRPEVWIEKDALVGVIEPTCLELRVPYFACRGYVSASAIWRAGRRLRDVGRRGGQKPIVFHLGDHDPSGLDMTRDNTERLDLFAEQGIAIRRLALNKDQVEHYNPPPNPTKTTDSRAADYIAVHGNDSWELDALEPSVIADLVRENVLAIRDDDLWDPIIAREQEHRRHLHGIAEHWDDVIADLDERLDEDV